MYRLLVAALLLGVCSFEPGQAPATRAQAPDEVNRIVTELGTALASGRAEGFRKLALGSLSQSDAKIVETEFAAGKPTGATVRERARVADKAGFDVLADVFLSRGRAARISSWRLSLEPVAPGDKHLGIAAIQEQAAFGGLIKLALDDSKQFSVHDLVFHSVNFTLKMASGSAFVASSAEGGTAVVLLGKASLDFSPPDAAEQAQLRVLTGHPALDTPVESAFIRVNPAEFASHFPDHVLTPRAVDAENLVRARDIFDRMAPQSFSLDLREIGEQGWSLTPGKNNLVVEFKAARFGWLTYARAPTEPEDISLINRGAARLFSLYASPDTLATRGPVFDEDAGRPYDVERYTLDVTFDPSRIWIGGKASLFVKLLDDHVNSLSFRLDEGLDISSVTTPGVGRLLAIRISGQNRVMVSLPVSLKRGAEILLDISYSGRLPPQPLDRETISPDSFTGSPIQQNYIDTFQPDPEPLFIYSGRLAWYPQAFVSDYAAASMRLTVPAEFSVDASGELVRSALGTMDDATRPGMTKPARSMEFAANRPVRYLGCVIGRLQPAAQGHVDVPRIAPVSSLIPNGDAAGSAPAGSPAAATPADAAVVNLDVVATPREVAQNRQLQVRLADIFGFYARTIGEAPYPSLSVAVTDDNLPGGHSPAFMTIWRQALPTTPFDWRTDVVAFNDFPYFLLSHELAHQWWGQAVGWENYHEQWLSEGLAQYFAVMYLESNQGDAAMRKVLGQMRESAMRASSRGPISLGYRLGHIENDGRSFRAIVYNKSAVVLHMLRQLIGDDAFLAGLRRYYRDHRFQKAGTDDLRAAFEAETPMRLSRFFERWITSPDIPRLKVSSHIDAGGLSATVHVEQVGNPFMLPLTFQVEYADGRSEELMVPVGDSITDKRLTFKSKVRKLTVKDDLLLAVIL